MEHSLCVPDWSLHILINVKVCNWWPKAYQAIRGLLIFKIWLPTSSLMTRNLLSFLHSLASFSYASKELTHPYLCTLEKPSPHQLLTICKCLHLTHWTQQPRSTLIHSVTSLIDHIYIPPNSKILQECKHLRTYDKESKVNNLSYALQPSKVSPPSFITEAQVASTEYFTQLYCFQWAMPGCLYSKIV